jgi:hypothetical protein
MPVERTNRNGGDHDQPNWAQHLALAVQPLVCPRVRF